MQHPVDRINTFLDKYVLPWPGRFLTNRFVILITSFSCGSSMKISVICPVYNEIRFVRAHVEQALRFATEIIYYDCGSTDGTREFLAGYSRVYPSKVRLLYHRTPYHEALWEPYLWNESEVRNHLIDCCSSEWICNLDADELFPEDTHSAIPEILTTKRHFVRLGQRAFWYEPYLIMVRQADTLDHWRRFYPSGRQYRFFKNTPVAAGAPPTKLVEPPPARFRSPPIRCSRMASQEHGITVVV